MISPSSRNWAGAIFPTTSDALYPNKRSAPLLKCLMAPSISVAIIETQRHLKLLINWLLFEVVVLDFAFRA
jgi:hypothetical protein